MIKKEIATCAVYKSKLALNLKKKKKLNVRGPGDHSEVKSTHNSHRGPKFGSQNPHWGLTMPVAPTPGDPTSSSSH